MFFFVFELGTRIMGQTDGWMGKRPIRTAT